MARVKVDDIKKSFYRSAERRALCTRKITEFYRKLLGREPDRGGLNDKVKRCVGGQQTMSSIALDMQRSPEYKRASESLVIVTATVTVTVNYIHSHNIIGIIV